MMLHKKIEHANGWVLYKDRESIGKLRKGKADQWYHPRVRWNNPRQTKKSEATWAMALEIKKVWEKLKTEKSDIGGITILRSMNLLDDLSSRVADALCVEFREKTFDPAADDEWKAFYQTYLEDNNLPEYVFPPSPGLPAHKPASLPGRSLPAHLPARLPDGLLAACSLANPPPVCAPAPLQPTPLMLL